VVGWQAKAAEQFKELSDRSEDLRLMITEREALQKNCDSLKVSVEDLLAQIRRREIEHEESLDAMQMQFASAKGAMVSKEQPKEVGVKKVQPDLTLLEESKHDRSRVVVQRKEEVERLDTNVLGVDISDIPTADKLFESTVVSGSNKKLRRFKGHRNTEDVKEVYRDSDGMNERAKSLQERAEAYRSSLGDTESVDDIAFLIAKEELLAEQRRKRT